MSCFREAFLGQFCTESSGSEVSSSVAWAVCTTARERLQQKTAATAILFLVLLLFIFGAKPHSLSEKKAEVAAVIKWTVNSAVIEMCKRATEAGSQKSSWPTCNLCRRERGTVLQVGLVEERENEERQGVRADTLPRSSIPFPVSIPPCLHPSSSPSLHFLFALS